MDMNLVIGLLTAAVILLSVVILVLLAVIIAVLLKLRGIMKNVNQITGNIASATAWLSPVKLIRELGNVFKH